MVITEMCTRDIPFAELMLEKKEIIDLICGKKDESILKVLVLLLFFFLLLFCVCGLASFKFFWRRKSFSLLKTL